MRGDLMVDLIKQIEQLRNSDTRKIVEQRLSEFSAFRNKPNEEWFSELCFCLLTANSKARTAISIQKELGGDGFCSCAADDIRQCIIRNKHRFHNNKTKYIVEARKFLDIKDKIRSIVGGKGKHGEIEAREWLVNNIKGLGYKEASHFMRNVGYFNLSILDRHILNLMADNSIIGSKPDSLTPKVYKEIEQIFAGIAAQLGMSLAELDLYMWYMKTGEVLK